MRTLRMSRFQYSSSGASGLFPEYRESTISLGTGASTSSRSGGGKLISGPARPELPTVSPIAGVEYNTEMAANDSSSLQSDKKSADNQLLVFGYECKIYRDDVSATWIDEEKHLFPLVEDPTSTVDRFDIRHYLTVACLQDSSDKGVVNREQSVGGGGGVGVAGPIRSSMTTEESAVEEACDRERYADLHNGDVDELTYHEREFKKQQVGISSMDTEDGGYNYVGYNYNDNGNTTSTVEIGAELLAETENVEASSSDKKPITDLPFVPPPGLVIPSDITVPIKMKDHAIIEKTAKFIATNGIQMEIIIKTKQTNNAQFNFLYYNDPLNPYYKNLLSAIKDNTYKPSCNLEDLTENESTNERTPDNSTSPNHEDDDDDEGYLHPSLLKSSQDSLGAIHSLPLNVTYKPLANTNSAYSILVSKFKEVSGGSVPMEEEESPSSLQNNNSPNEYEYPSGMEQLAYSGSYNINMVEELQNYGVLQFDSSSSYVFGAQGLALIQNGYHGGVSYDDVQQDLVARNPPVTRSKPNAEEQVIIEKMAHYVTKNGPTFESVMETKGDPRFQFLDRNHCHNWYYLNCKRRFEVELNAVVASGNPIEYNPEQTSDVSQSAAPVSEAESTGISNHANALTRLATLPPQLISKIEELRQKSLQNKLLRETQQQEALADKKPVIKFSSSLANVNLGGSVSESTSAAGPVIPLITVNDSVSNNSFVGSDNSVPSNFKLATSTSSSNSSLMHMFQYYNDVPSPVEAAEQPSAMDVALHDTSSGLTSPMNNQCASSSDSTKLRLRAERRRKAALFLQGVKSTIPLSATEQSDTNQRNLNELASSNCHNFPNLLPGPREPRPYESPSRMEPGASVRDHNSATDNQNIDSDVQIVQTSYKFKRKRSVSSSSSNGSSYSSSHSRSEPARVEAESPQQPPKSRLKLSTNSPLRSEDLGSDWDEYPEIPKKGSKKNSDENETESWSTHQTVLTELESTSIFGFESQLHAELNLSLFEQGTSFISYRRRSASESSSGSSTSVRYDEDQTLSDLDDDQSTSFDDSRKIQGKRKAAEAFKEDFDDSGICMANLSLMNLSQDKEDEDEYISPVRRFRPMTTSTPVGLGTSSPNGRSTIRSPDLSPESNTVGGESSGQSSTNFSGAKRFRRLDFS